MSDCGGGGGGGVWRVLVRVHGVHDVVGGSGGGCGVVCMSHLLCAESIYKCDDDFSSLSLTCT